MLIGLASPLILVYVLDHNVGQSDLVDILDARHVVLFGIVATTVYAYRLCRFAFVRKVLRRAQSQQEIDFSKYARHP